MLMAMTMLVCSLTGCVGMEAKFSINSDGSGTFSMFAGMTEDGYIAAAGLEGSELPADFLSLFPEKLEYNGKVYYGETQSETFTNLDELNALLKDEEAEQDMSAFVFEKVDGGYILTIDTSEDIVSEEDVATQTGSEMTTEEELAAVKAIMEEMALIVEINYPDGTISKLDKRGNVPGLTQVSDSCYRIDLMAFSMAETGIESLQFALMDGDGKVEVPTEEPKENPKEEIEEDTTAPFVPFKDVFEGDWYYNSVTKMAKKGVVNGVGNDLFMPNDTLTYAQFSQMIYNTLPAHTLVYHDYWAYVAVENAVNNGFIKSLGEITPENYDVPINREEAIVALYRVINSEMNFGKPIEEYTTVGSYDIPDFADISPEYMKEVKDSYLIGLTHGSDELGSFYPKRSLTRAEMCQLFYNIMNDK